jgi:hypothetical protein
MVAWGIIMTGFTLFGMLALGMAMVSMTDTLAGTSHGEETGPGSYPVDMTHSADGSQTAGVRRAA